MAGSSSSGGGGGVPPGFRFHPTDEELLHFYLKKKVSFQKFDMEVIREVDLNKIEPWDLQERCKIGSTPQNEWYFFSHKDRKYPTGSRTNRATSAGFWKATGRDKCIRNSFKKIGMRKTLVFYRGRAPHGQKTDWIMHEYRLEDSDNDPPPNEDGWVVCRVFKKKNLFKIGGNDEGAMEDATGSTHSGSINQYLMHPHSDLNYSHHIPLHYPQLDPPPHTFNHLKPLMLTSAANYDHHSLTALPTSASAYDDHHQPSTATEDQGLDQSSLVRDDQEWDRLVVATSHHQDSNPNPINQINLRSEMNFWAYGK